MSTAFDTRDYIETMVNFSRSSKDFKPIELVTGTYMLDRAEDTRVVNEVANEMGLVKIPTSDVKTQYRREVNGKNEPVMYCITDINGKDERIYYKPRPGFAICPWIESYLQKHSGKVNSFDDFEKELKEANANLFAEKELIDEFADARDYGFTYENYNNAEKEQ